MSQCCSVILKSLPLLNMLAIFSNMICGGREDVLPRGLLRKDFCPARRGWWAQHLQLPVLLRSALAAKSWMPCSSMPFPGQPTLNELGERAEAQTFQLNIGGLSGAMLTPELPARVGKASWGLLHLWLFLLLSPASSPSFDPLRTFWTQTLFQCLLLENPTCDVASLDCIGFKYISALTLGFLGWFRTQVGKLWCHFLAPLASNSGNNTVVVKRGKLLFQSLCNLEEQKIRINQVTLSGVPYE